VVIYTQRLKTTVTRCWRLDQTNTSSTSGRKFRLWSRSDEHLLADCSRVVVRRQRTPDRQTVCLWERCNWHPISYRFGVIAAYCSNFGHFAFSSHPLGA